MADYPSWGTYRPPHAKGKGEGGPEAAEAHRIRITLTSCDVKAVEKVSADLIRGSKDKGLKVRGPIRMPRKILRLVSRQAPSGQGTQTFDTLEMRMYKRVVDLEAPTEVVRQITSISIEPNVQVEVTIAD